MGLIEFHELFSRVCAADSAEILAPSTTTGEGHELEGDLDALMDLSLDAEENARAMRLSRTVREHFLLGNACVECEQVGWHQLTCSMGG